MSIEKLSEEDTRNVIVIRKLNELIDEHNKLEELYDDHYHMVVSDSSYTAGPINDRDV